MQAKGIYDYQASSTEDTGENIFDGRERLFGPKGLQEEKNQRLYSTCYRKED